jgi:hypothetical protein
VEQQFNYGVFIKMIEQSQEWNYIVNCATIYIINNYDDVKTTDKYDLYNNFISYYSFTINDLDFAVWLTKHLTALKNIEIRHLLLAAKLDGLEGYVCQQNTKK